MLFCDTGSTELRAVEDLAVFVSQLAAAGVEARIHVRSVPEGLSRNAQFDLAPFLIDRAPTPEDRFVLVSAERFDDAKLVALRRLVGPGLCCHAFGCFGSRQAAIGTTARLSYLFGSEPLLFDLAEGGSEAFGGPVSAPVFGTKRRSAFGSTRLRLLIVDPDLGDFRQAAALVALSVARRFDVTVLAGGRAKEEWLAAHGTDIAFYHYGEVLPADLAERVDVCVCFGAPERHYRFRCLLANLALSGAALIDATAGRDLVQWNDAFVRGPPELSLLAGFLDSEIVPNRGEVARHVRASRAAASAAPESVLRFLGATSKPRAPRPAASIPRIVFVPTNGIGLGHAQRCGLIARELDPSRAKPAFAAFPSCTGLVKSFGFDVMPLIGRSAFHAQSFENDLANYLRLRALTAEARTLVFDGGYVFDSIYRSILENRLAGVWIRRGLWQAGQNNQVALDREKVFERVIVPREAFEELNTSLSSGPHLREVGPIVGPASLSPDDRRALRENLARRFGRPFERLVVSMLGGGVAADRGAQIQALCGMVERRPDTLHLVVVWPGGTQQPSWFGWEMSRVVRTRHAGVLVAAADLCVGAAGYNLFHEVLYNRIPAVFLPQVGPFMDDQRARARAASDRGLAKLVEPTELMRLEREIGRLLDGGEGEAVASRIAAADLPPRGNTEAAQLIEEVSGGLAGLDGDHLAHFASGSR